MFLLQWHIVCISLNFLLSATWGAPIVEKKRQTPQNWAQRNFNTVKSIYELTIFPNQLPILEQGAAGVPPGLFNEAATGRVDPVGNFSGFDDSIEYFFALAPVPSTNAASTAITSIQITEFSSACPGVAASVVYLYCNVYAPGSADDGIALAPLKEIAFWKFDDCGAVVKYDAWIPNLNDWIVAGLGIQISNPQVAAESIGQLCGGTQQRCTGANTQWDSIDQCVETLSQKPYGNYDEAWGDNIVCRTIHLVLTQVRPDVHCPHVGPTGGGKCVDYAYPLEYFADEALYGDPVGKTFTCDNCE